MKSIWAGGSSVLINIKKVRNCKRSNKSITGVMVLPRLKNDEMKLEVIPTIAMIKNPIETKQNKHEKVKTR